MCGEVELLMVSSIIIGDFVQKGCANTELFSHGCILNLL
jgi:hypothetical protein